MNIGEILKYWILAASMNNMGSVPSSLATNVSRDVISKARNDSGLQVGISPVYILFANSISLFSDSLNFVFRYSYQEHCPQDCFRNWILGKLTWNLYCGVKREKQIKFWLCFQTLIKHYEIPIKINIGKKSMKRFCI